MSIIKEYKAYRNISRELIHKVMEQSLGRDRLLKSAKLLGIAQGDILVFRNENETHMLMDFALHEYREDDKNVISIYKEKVGLKSAIEKEIVEAWLSSSTSLFKISSVFPSDGICFLEDLLNQNNNIKLIDIGLSQTASPGFLLFIRLVPFKDAFMTSGVSFVFPPHLEKYLVRKYKKLARKTDPTRLAEELFIFFFKQNRVDGLEVWFE